MAKRLSKSKPTWTDVKAKLAGFDHPALLSLVQNLYDANRDNQVFLHARFGLGKDALGPYRKTIDRWLWPDAFRGQDTSVSKAKQAISDYKKALGDPEGVGELMVFYCERAAGFSRAVSHADTAYFDALVRMFQQETTNILAGNIQSGLLLWLDRVRNVCHGFGYGVGDDMDILLSEFVQSFSTGVLHGNRRRKG